MGGTVESRTNVGGAISAYSMSPLPSVTRRSEVGPAHLPKQLPRQQQAGSHRHAPLQQRLHWGAGSEGTSSAGVARCSR